MNGNESERGNVPKARRWAAVAEVTAVGYGLLRRLGVDGRVIESVEVLERNHPLYDWPTTGAIAGDDLLYIANSQLRSFDETNSILPEGRLHPTYILRLDLGGGVHPVAPPR